MIIKFLKKHPTNFGWRNRIGQVGKYNPGATIKAMNLITQGYAELVHSCKNCNPYHLNIHLEDFKKPFKKINKFENKLTSLKVQNTSISKMCNEMEQQVDATIVRKINKEGEKNG